MHATSSVDHSTLDDMKPELKVVTSAKKLKSQISLTGELCVWQLYRCTCSLSNAGEGDHCTFAAAATAAAAASLAILALTLLTAMTAASLAATPSFWTIRVNSWSTNC